MKLLFRKKRMLSRQSDEAASGEPKGGEFFRGGGAAGDGTRQGRGQQGLRSTGELSPPLSLTHPIGSPPPLTP